MNAFKKIIDCEVCQKTIKNPVKLTCQKSICKHHIDKSTIYDCKLCSTKHSTYLISANTPLNNIINTLGRIEASIKRFELIKERPSEFIDLYIDELRNKIDLKREEIKLELEKKTNEIRQDMDYLQKDCKKKLFSFNLNKQISTLMNSLRNFLRVDCQLDEKTNSNEIVENLINFSNSKIDETMEQLTFNIDESCITLIDELDEYRNTCTDKLNLTKSYVDIMLNKMKKYKEEIQFLAENLTGTCEYSLKRTNHLLIQIMCRINKDLIALRNEILLEQGFEFEKKQFLFPQLEYFENKNRGTLELSVKNVSVLSSACRLLFSEKSMINYIPFGVGVRFYKSKYGTPLVGIGLTFENKYEFSTIVANYEVYLTDKENKSKRLIKRFKQYCNRVNSPSNFKKLLLLSELIHNDFYDCDEDIMRLSVNVELEGLKIRSINDLV